MPSRPETRRRTIPFRYGPSLRAHVTTSGTYVQDEVLPERAYDGTQVTVSSGHPWPPPKGDPTDVGGDFWTQRRYVDAPDFPNRLIETYISTLPGLPPTKWIYNGPVLPTYVVSASFPGFPPHMSSSNDQLDVLGAIAVDRCAPTNSVADASVFLGETIKEGLPSMIASSFWKERASFHRKVGGEYLNYQFGWVPFLSDIKKLAAAIKHADAVLEQYERDSGKVVRRRYNFPLNESTSIVQKVLNDPVYGPQPVSKMFVGGQGSGTRIVERKFTQRRWFSGAFTYHLESGSDSRSEMKRIAQLSKHLLGLTITPEVLWNLAPWSWAVDWFSNSGSVLSNLSDQAVDGLVMRYGYMMEHTIVKDTYTNVGPVLLGRNPNIPSLTLVTETKIRRKANPFGFGVMWEGLSPFQLSIAAALGLSRGR